MRQAAADGAPTADGEVADLTERLADQRPLPEQRRALDRVLARHGADHQPAVLGAEIGQAGDTVQVDQVRRPREPEVHQRHEALAPRERLGGISERPEELQCLVDVPRIVIVEDGWLQAAFLPAWPQRGAKI